LIHRFDALMRMVSDAEATRQIVAPKPLTNLGRA
jgi:hypothetical protein